MFTPLFSKNNLLTLLALIIWIVVHIPAIFYGTHELPLHQTYVGDEQSPVNGALHMLEDKSIFAIKDLKTVYYGPVFSLITVPAVIVDFGEKIIFEDVRTADDYKNALIWDWGGIVWKLRLMGTVFTFLGLLGIYKILTAVSVNPQKKILPIILGTLLIATNFYYFEYASFWKHWVIVIPALIWQIYVLIRYRESNYEKKWLYYSAALFFISFGVSYLGIIFQIMWLPVIISLIREKNIPKLRQLVYYFVALLLVVALVVAWHPRAFWRITGLIQSDIANTDQSIYTSEKSAEGLSFVYYGMLILVNHLALIICALISLFLLLKNKIIQASTWFVPIALVGMTSYLIFGSMSHHESRYCLPVIISLLMLLACMLPAYLSISRKKIIDVIMITLFLCGFAYHIVHIGLINGQLSEGPTEESVIAKLIEFKKENPESKTLAVQHYLFGYVHTKEAYAAFAEATAKDDLNLYKAIADAPLPQGEYPINVYYLRPDNEDAFSFDKHAEYDHVLYRIQTHMWLNQFDFFDENLLRLWWYDQFWPKYIWVK